MMDSRRDFLKKALLLAAGGGFAGALPASVQRAFAIDPAPGSTFLDAEHVVILMQENRSFDHAFGTLQGVRGYNDRLSLELPDGNPVWLQTSEAGQTYAPFRLDIKDTNATWMGSLPHSRQSQIGARHDGRHDRWLDFKRLEEARYAHVPMTMGYYTREDIPFYYALADAFTICDQNFCSSLTPTTPNRLHLWTGTVRPYPSMEAKAHVNNEDTDYDAEASWKTFPERLEEHGISWRIYQNEINIPSGLDGEVNAWLANFSDNPLEWFTQYHVRFSATHRQWLEEESRRLGVEIDALRAGHATEAGAAKQLAQKNAELERIKRDLAAYTPENFAKLPEREQALHLKAFTVNSGDPNYRKMATMSYREVAGEKEMQVPKGDVLHQFREDVRNGRLPMVSWIVPPERFSDHPCSPWYGAWYLSETLDILTQNPEVWKKTIFILCYDENDGYFDHVPPFVPPEPNRTDTGKVSNGLDVSLEHVPASQPDSVGPIGLGFRVPLLIASPWSRGGCVCSQVFDHTSILMFLENFLGHKTGKQIFETNISPWRRTICGDLSSSFRPWGGEQVALPKPVEREPFLSSIYEARLKPTPNNYHLIGAEEAARMREHPEAGPWRLAQEKGGRPSCALPYELAAHGRLKAEGTAFTIQFAAGNQVFGLRAAGAPFHVYTPGRWRDEAAGRSWDYAVVAGDQIEDTWKVGDFPEGVYHLRVHGPNGFYREFHGDAQGPQLEIVLGQAGGDAVVTLTNRDASRAMQAQIDDVAYGEASRHATVAPSSVTRLTIPLARSHQWHDLRFTVAGFSNYWQRFAGRIETGADTMSDPAMAG